MSDGISAEQAVSILGEEDFDVLMDGVEEAAQHAAERYDMEFPDPAIDTLQQFFIEQVVLVEERSDDPNNDQLIEEMKNPTERPAQTNISLAIGTQSRKHESIRNVANAALEEKYSKARE